MLVFARLRLSFSLSLSLRLSLSLSLSLRLRLWVWLWVCLRLRLTAGDKCLHGSCGAILRSHFKSLSPFKRSVRVRGRV